MSDTIDSILKRFNSNCKDHLSYHVPQLKITRINENDSNWPLTFYREYVAKNVPVLIKNGCKHFPAVNKWNSEYFMNTLPDKDVEISITPNGYADSVTLVKNPKTDKNEKLFMLPEARQIKMKQFLNYLDEPKNNFVCYIQRQNSNFTEDFQELSADAPSDVEWASQAFNKKPDAINFWMGDSRAVTSIHKDFYENIYCVIDGYKDFTVGSPTDYPYMPYKDFKVAEYKNIKPENEDNFEILNKLDEQGNYMMTPWIDIDPINPDIITYPQFKDAELFEVRVEKGDCLYIPSLWFHHVRQSHKCIAMNYWYDMNFDLNYCYHKLLIDLSNSRIIK